jgi:hypothetical protein
MPRFSKTFRSCASQFVCFLVLSWIGSLSTVKAVRLQISDVECFRENIESSQSQVTLTLVSDDLHGKPVYFDLMVRSQSLE